MRRRRILTVGRGDDKSTILRHHVDDLRERQTHPAFTRRVRPPSAALLEALQTIVVPAEHPRGLRYRSPVTSTGPPPPNPASAATMRANAGVLDALDFAEQADFARASRGLLAQIDPPVIRGTGGNVVWDLGEYGFLDGDSPSEVNPSLWRQAQLNRIHGLFEVCDGIYQVRGYDPVSYTHLTLPTILRV